VELSADAGKRRDPRLPWLYVVSSAKSPEARFAQHKRGYKSSRYAKRFGLRLRPDLYEDLQPIRAKREAVAAEQARARELAGCGFVAHCDGTSYGRDVGGGDWSEWDLDRLEPVIGHLDTAIAELYECSFRPLDPETCSELLFGAHGFWVPDYLDQEDPPPSYGLFPHVMPEALARRTRELLDAGKVSERSVSGT
jgi:hypothetical protein